MNTLVIALFLFVWTIQIHGYIRYLTPGQWGSIRHILTHPDTPVDIIQKTRKVIYTHYENWAIQRAVSFRENRPWLCKRVTTNEMAIYATRGLIKAIEGCDFGVLQHASFSVYASKWVDYELLEGMTELQPLTTLPKRLRKRKGIHNRRYFRVEQLGKRDYLAGKHTNPRAEKEEYEDAWEKVDAVCTDTFTKRAFRWKYSPTLEQVRSNAEVAELMGCSEEIIRRALE
jgi:hypothetical protein